MVTPDRSSWMLELALALAAKPDLRLEAPFFVRLIVAHAPVESARVWARRGTDVVIVASHPASGQPDDETREAVHRMLTPGGTAPKSGATLVDLGPTAVLEIDGAGLEPGDLEGLERVAASVAQRVQSANLLEAIVENLPDMVFVKDATELRFVHFNRAGQSLVGFSREQLIGRNDHDFFPREEADFFIENDRAVLASGQPLDIPEESIHTADQGTRTLHTRKIPIMGSDGKPAYLLGISRDITERQQIDARLNQSQKLEAVTQLTAALAHNFNNAAMVISGYAELVQRELEGSESRASAFLGKLRRASARISDLASRLLIFAQSRVIDSVVTDVSRLLEETAQMVGPLLGERITIERDDIEPDCFARLDRGQFEQVVVNLALNAKDAMPRGGTLRLSLSGDGDRLRLAMADTGSGMSKEVARRAFDPFFTTKPAGVGSGLGLFSVNEIVKRHDGEITIESEPDQGTTVLIELPRSQRPTTRETRRQEARSSPGNETILIVEDDDDVREVLAECLEARDYDVLTAASGPEALELIRDLEDEPIDLLLSDVVMPKMSGPELVALVRALRPDTPAILVSGYTDEDEALAGDPNLVFLAKPVETERLLTVVRELLDG